MRVSENRQQAHISFFSYFRRHLQQKGALTNDRRAAHKKDSLSRSAQMLVHLRTEFVLRLEFSTAFSKIL